MERRVPGWFEHCSNPLHLLRRGCWCNDLLQGSPLCWNSLFFERILTCFALQDANELLLNPIERMIEKMETIKDNPLAAGKPTNRKPRIFFRASSFKLSNGPWGDAFGRSRIPPRGGGGGTLRKTTHHCCCLNSLKLKQKKTPNSLWNVSSVWSCMVCTVLSTHSSYATCLTLVCEKWTLIVLRLILFHQFFNSS